MVSKKSRTQVREKKHKSIPMSADIQIVKRDGKREVGKREYRSAHYAAVSREMSVGYDKRTFRVILADLVDGYACFFGCEFIRRKVFSRFLKSADGVILRCRAESQS